MTHTPATDFLADLHSGRVSPQEMRERWKQGHYAGLRSDWAKAWFNLAGVK